MANVYNRTKRNALEGDLELDSAVIKCLLLKTSALAFDPDHNFVADVIAGAGEVTVAGYARQTLGSKTFAQDDTNNRGEAKNNELTFGPLTAGETIGAAVVYREVTNDADSVVVAHYDLADTPTNGGSEKIQFDGLATAGAFLRSL